MRLTLRLDNVDRLENGGATRLELDGRGACVGRETSMDWVLPDLTVSGHHFSIHFRDGGYWIEDRSSNGTYRQGQPYRLQEPVVVHDGDRFVVRPYLIVAEFDAPSDPDRQPGDPWGLSDEVDDAIPDVDGWRPAPLPIPGNAVRYAAPGATSSSQRNVLPPPAPQAPPVTSGTLRGALTLLCEGAGIDMASVAATDPERTLREAGRALRAVTTLVMRILRDRAHIKEAIGGGERTLIERADNNPLKFAPTPEAAIEAILMNPRDGFLEGAEAYKDALDDLRGHQEALFAAIQPALAELLEGLSPAEVEAEAGRGLLGPSGRRSWQVYASRWETRAGGGENGMLDPFLRTLARVYAERSGR